MESGTVGLILASVTAVATVALVTSTVAFYLWTWRQRSPKLRLAEGEVRFNDSRSCTIRLTLVNPGDVPVFLQGAGVISHRGFRSHEAYTGKSLSVTESPDEVARPLNEIRSRGAGFVTFMVEEPDQVFSFSHSDTGPLIRKVRFGVIITYLSGQNRRDFRLKKVHIIWRNDEFAYILGPLTWRERVRRTSRTIEEGWRITD